MKYAIHSDVHGNLPALEAVLSDVEGQGASKILHCGNLVEYGPFPNEAINLIRSRGIAGVMGNYDDGAGSQRDDFGCAYTDDEKRSRIAVHSMRATMSSLSALGIGVSRGAERATL